jgi:hypothetical protein
VRPWWCALVLLPCLASLCSGQTLGDAAQQEHARREKLGKTGGPSRTLTDDDLAAGKSKTAKPDATPPAPTEDEDALAPDRDAELPATHIQAETEVTASSEGKEEYWRGRAAQAKNRLAVAQQRYDSLQRQIHFGQPERYNQNGQRVIYSIYQMKEKADAAEAELHAAEQSLEDLYTDARRAGALPGWLR